MSDHSAAADPIPTFYLYGEPQRNVSEGFVHVENLDDRSRPSEWTIRPHLHRDLNHIILIAEGGGSMRAEMETLDFEAPCLLTIPAGVVHGFTWHRDSRGWVTTIADSYLHQIFLRDGDLAALFRTAQAVMLTKEESRRTERTIRTMMQELDWTRPGQRTAVEAGLLSLMLTALRRLSIRDQGFYPDNKCMLLVARLRERIDRHFRDRMPVATHAQALGVSESLLRQACAKVAAISPSAMQDERALLEARRMLLYSNLSVAQISFAVGFEDPAYFSRFFSRHVGFPPGRYRQQKGRCHGA